jgi:hypothetical protein
VPHLEVVTVSSWAFRCLRNYLLLYYTVLQLVLSPCNVSLLCCKVDMADRQENRVGFSKLWRGTEDRGIVMVGDNGFNFPIPDYLQEMGIMSPSEWCEANNVLFLHPFTDRDNVGLHYDRSTDQVTLVDIA